MNDTQEKVTAIIRVSMSPESSEGYDRIARRINQYDEVESLYLVSGSNDLLVTVAEKSINDAAIFVNEHIASIAGVLGTETQFVLKKYKENGEIFVKAPEQEERIRFI